MRLQNERNRRENFERDSQSKGSTDRGEQAVGDDGPVWLDTHQHTEARSNGAVELDVAERQSVADDEVRGHHSADATRQI